MKTNEQRCCEECSYTEVKQPKVKKVIMIGTKVFLVLASGVILYKNKNYIINVGGKLKNTILGIIQKDKLDKSSVQSLIQDTGKLANERMVHIPKTLRNLPPNKKASIKKIETALDNGFNLKDNQTWVVDYSKKVKSAS